MALVLTIGGNDRTSVLCADTLNVEHRAESFVSVCTLSLVDAAADIAIAAEDVISVVDGATTFFSGRVVTVNYVPFTSNSRYILLECQDHNALVGETVIDGAVDLIGAYTDATIIDYLFDNYLPAVDSETFVDTLQDPMEGHFLNVTLTQALSQICTQTGGFWYVDFDNALHYFAAEADVAAWWLSDDPDQVDSFSYFDIVSKLSNAVTRLDGVFVVGAGLGMSKWRGTHVPGDRQKVVTDNRITTEAGLDARGDAALAKYGAEQVTYEVSTYKAGLMAGMDVRFICALYDEDDTLTVRTMTVQWDVEGTAFYTLELGDSIFPSLQRERIIDDSIGESLGPITSPRLPLASMGWSHDIEFLASDHDTLEWLGGGTIETAAGDSYAIDAGNTINITPGALRYIYLDIDTSETVLQQVEDAPATATGANIILVAVATPADVTKDVIFQVFGGQGVGVLVAADSIAANAITANHVGANTIVTGSANIDTAVINNAHISTAYADRIVASKINIGGTPVFSGVDILLMGMQTFKEIGGAWYLYSTRAERALLTGALHQEPGRWPGFKGLVFDPATVNLVTNPSIEVDTTGWNARNGATLIRSTVHSRYGAASLKVTIDADNEGAFSGLFATAASTAHTASVWVRGSGNWQLRIREATAASATVGYTSQTFTATRTWQRITVSRTFGATGVKVSMYVQAVGAQNAIVYMDGMQIEALPCASSAAIGGMGYGYTLTDPCTRTKTEVNLDAYTLLCNAKTELSFRVVAQAPRDSDATWFGTYAFLWTVYEDADNRLQLYYQTALEQFIGIYEESTVVKTVAVNASFLEGDWLDIVMTVDTAGDLKLYVDNVLGATTDISALSTITPAQWNLGSGRSGANQGGWNIAEYAVFGKILTADEIAIIHTMANPLVDGAAQDKPGIYILDGQFQVASSLTGNRIVIDADAIQGLDNTDTLQFELRASDGKATAGGGNVILDENGLILLEGVGNVNLIKWRPTAAGTNLGAITTDWDGGVGDDITLWVTAYEQASSKDGVVSIQALPTAGSGAYIKVKSTGYIELILGDAAGADELQIKDNAFATRATIDSDGNARFWGTLRTTANTAWDFGGAAAGVPVASHGLYVKVAGVEYYILADQI